MVINRIRCETTGYYVEIDMNGGFVHHGGEMDQDVKVRVFCSVESTSYFKVAAVWAAENRYLKVRRRFYRRIGIGGRVKKGQNKNYDNGGQNRRFFGVMLPFRRRNRRSFRWGGGAVFYVTRSLVLFQGREKCNEV